MTYKYSVRENGNSGGYPFDINGVPHTRKECEDLMHDLADALGYAVIETTDDYLKVGGTTED